MNDSVRFFKTTVISAFILVLLVLIMAPGCGREAPRNEYYKSPPKPKPYPSAEVQRAKDMMDQGGLLFSKAIDADTQGEKDELAREALDRHYFPAQEILDRLKDEYPEHQYSIESLYQELNRRILDANRIIGTGG